MGEVVCNLMNEQIVQVLTTNSLIFLTSCGFHRWRNMPINATESQKTYTHQQHPYSGMQCILIIFTGLKETLWCFLCVHIFWTDCVFERTQKKADGLQAIPINSKFRWAVTRAVWHTKHTSDAFCAFSINVWNMMWKLKNPQRKINNYTYA